MANIINTRMAGGFAGAAMLIALPLVAGWEGLRTDAYLDAVGVPTICYGSTEGVRVGQSKTVGECDQLLQKELKTYLQAVDGLVIVPITAERRAALASFAYNVGVENFKRSTLLRKLNGGDTLGACNELRRWVYAKGKYLRGLARRREAERKLCIVGLENVSEGI
jgi:lysozyme